jgi:methionyl-tRNA formyltransferase
MKIIFMGTSNFSLQVLQALHQAFEVVLVVSQPGKPQGRKQLIMPSPVTTYALAHQLPLVTPSNLSKEIKSVTNVPCDFIVTASFGQYVPTKVLNHPQIEAINIHASLLPKYRGASPIHQAVANGDTVTGVSFMKMVKEMDAGDVYHQVSIAIDPNANTKQVIDALGQLSAKEIVPFLQSFDQYPPVAQNLQDVSEANKIDKSIGYLDFQSTSNHIHNQLRAFDDEPGCRVLIHNIEVKLFQGLIGDQTRNTPSNIVRLDKSGLYISCLDNEYIIHELQVPGKKRQQVSEFIQGNKWIKVGDKVGVTNG